MAVPLCRVVAYNADGTGCILLMPAEKQTDNPESDASFYPRMLTYMQAGSPDTYGKTFVDMAPEALPPLDQQPLWQIINGQVVIP
jgi:hypothetical protein